MNQNSLSMQVNTDQKFIAQETSTQRVLEIRIHAPKAADQRIRPPLNLALVLDRSGSMSGEKLEFRCYHPAPGSPGKIVWSSSARSQDSGQVVQLF